MTFEDLKSQCVSLRSLLHDSVGRDVVQSVSVEEPKGPQDELHFVRLVAWSYVFLFEASQPALRHLTSLLRAADPADHARATSVFEVVNNLRTAHFHNLSPESKRDAHKQRQARIWLLRAGGEPPNWEKCCVVLSSDVAWAVGRIAARWSELLTNSDDSKSNVEDLNFTIVHEWPPHVFDSLVQDAADNLGINGLDCVKYRQDRLEDWRKLVAFFPAQEDAKVAMAAAIQLELNRTFGSRMDTGAVPTS